MGAQINNIHYFYMHNTVYYNDKDGLGQNLNVHKSESNCQTPVIISSCFTIYHP